MRVVRPSPAGDERLQVASNIDSDLAKAKDIRNRAQAIREQGLKLKERAEAMPEGRMRDMLEGEAEILVQAGRDLEAKALELTPAAGTA